MKRDLCEQRASENVIRGARAERIKSDRAKEIPTCHGPIIFVARKSLRARIVHFGTDAAGPVFRFPGLADCSVKIENVEYRLIAVRVLSKLGICHLRHL